MKFRKNKQEDAVLTTSLLFVAYFLLVRIGRENDANTCENQKNWVLRVPDNVAEHCRVIRASWQED